MTVSNIIYSNFFVQDIQASKYDARYDAEVYSLTPHPNGMVLVTYYAGALLELYKLDKEELAKIAVENLIAKAPTVISKNHINLGGGRYALSDKTFFTIANPEFFGVIATVEDECGLVIVAPQNLIVYELEV